MKKVSPDNHTRRDGILFRKSSLRSAAVAAFSFLICLGNSGRLSAQEFESPPLLKASDLLEAAWLKSELHSVDSEVKTDTKLYHFNLHSEYGDFDVYGIDFLKIRVREIHAIAALKKKLISVSAVGGAVDETVETGKTLFGALKRPVRTIVNLPKGLASFAKRSAGSVKKGGNYTGGPVRDWFNVSEKTLHLAEELGVDPYTDNELLHKKLNLLSGSSAVGGIGLRLIVPFDGIIKVANEGEAERQLDSVYTTAPTRLFKENVEMLKAMGVSDDAAKAFLDNEVHSPAEQSLMIRALSGMKDADGIETVLEAAGETPGRMETIMFRICIDLLKLYHDQGNAMQGFGTFRGYPIGVTGDNRLIIPIYLDHAYWSERAHDVADAIEIYRKESGCSATELIVTGELTERTRAELKARGVKVLKARS